MVNRVFFGHDSFPAILRRFTYTSHLREDRQFPRCVSHLSSVCSYSAAKTMPQWTFSMLATCTVTCEGWSDPLTSPRCWVTRVFNLNPVLQPIAHKYVTCSVYSGGSIKWGEWVLFNGISAPIRHLVPFKIYDLKIMDKDRLKMQNCDALLSQL